MHLILGWGQTADIPMAEKFCFLRAHVAMVNGGS
jgi:hypothetical protein